MYESSTKETKWVCIQLACSWRPRAFEEAHRRNIQAKLYNEKFPLVWTRQYMRLTILKTWCYFEAQIYETHYMKNKMLLWSTNIWDSLHEEQRATLKHKCGKRIVTLPLLSFSLFFCLASLASLFLFPHMEQCSNNDDHHTSIYLQLKDYNSILEQIWLYMSASDGVPGWAMNQEWHGWKIVNGVLATNTMSTTWSCKAIWQ